MLKLQAKIQLMFKVELVYFTFQSIYILKPKVFIKAFHYNQKTYHMKKKLVSPDWVLKRKPFSYTNGFNKD